MHTLQLTSDFLKKTSNIQFSLLLFIYFIYLFIQSLTLSGDQLCQENLDNQRPLYSSKPNPNKECHTHTPPFSQEKTFIQIQNGLTSVTGSFLFLFFLATPALMGLRKTKQHPRRMATMPSVCARWCRWARAGGLTPGTISRQEV